MLEFHDCVRSCLLPSRATIDGGIVQVRDDVVDSAVVEFEFPAPKES